MKIRSVYFKDDELVLQDVDGSTVTMSVSDAADLARWLIDHQAELQEHIAPAERLRRVADDIVNTDPGK